MMLPWIAWGLLIAAITFVLSKIRANKRDSREWKDENHVDNPEGLPACPMNSVEPLAPFDWAAKEPLQFRPFKPVYHITMALQSSSPQDLIVMDRNYQDRVLERRQLTIQHPATVVGAIPSGEAAIDELYSYLMVEYLPRRFPTMFALEQDGKIFRNTITGATFPTKTPQDPKEALRTLAETVDDDIFLLQQTPEGHRSIAYVCCYPSGFDPSEKLDKLLVDIHEPVPSYHKIGPSMERFFGRVEVGKNVKRVNWSIVDSPILFNCQGNHVLESDVEAVVKDEDIDISKARMRVELQTVSRLPKTKTILFSFKTHLYTLEEIKAEGLGQQLADAVDGLGRGNAPDMWTYKGAIRWGKKVKEYLRS